MRMVQRELYREGLKYFELNDLTKTILKPIIAGDDKATDFEDCVKTDPTISRQIILDANLQIKNGSVQSISHAVVLIGKNRVRDFIFSNCILAFMINDQDIIFQKISKEKKFLRYAEETENFSRKLGSDYSGGAWAVGFLFDFLDNLLAHRDLKKVFDENFKECWAHSIKTAAMAWSFANISKLPNTLCRQAFLAGLTHDIGRILMWLVFPQESIKILEDFARFKQGAQQGLQWETQLELEIERKYLNIGHNEIGSMLLSATDFMSEVEEIVAFHHDIGLLKARSSKMLQVAQCVNLADDLVEGMNSKRRIGEEEISKSLDKLISSLNITAPAVLGVIESLKTKQVLL